MADALIVIDMSTNQRGKDARICDLANCWFVPSFVAEPRSVVWELSLRQRKG